MRRFDWRERLAHRIAPWLHEDDSQWRRAQRELAAIAYGDADAIWTSPEVLVTKAIENAKRIGAVEADMARAVDSWTVIGREVNAEVLEDHNLTQVRLNQATFVARHVVGCGHTLEAGIKAALSVEAELNVDGETIDVSWSAPPDVQAQIDDLIS